uniref:Uncharacterized protein n=1 Tax=Ditylenchus dipsaci TaxID=166011 RepID=A0A915E406_9BILA
MVVGAGSRLLLHMVGHAIVGGGHVAASLLHEHNPRHLPKLDPQSCLIEAGGVGLSGCAKSHYHFGFTQSGSGLKREMNRQVIDEQLYWRNKQSHVEDKVKHNEKRKINNEMSSWSLKLDIAVQEADSSWKRFLSAAANFSHLLLTSTVFPAAGYGPATQVRWLQESRPGAMSSGQPLSASPMTPIGQHPICHKGDQQPNLRKA